MLKTRLAKLSHRYKKENKDNQTAQQSAGTEESQWIQKKVPLGHLRLSKRTTRRCVSRDKYDLGATTVIALTTDIRLITVFELLGKRDSSCYMSCDS